MPDPLTSFCTQHGISPIRSLGSGREGAVYETTRPSAVKVHSEHGGYVRERDAYLRLQELSIKHIRGLRIPTLFTFDDEHRILEMSIVQPPFLLDFGSAWLDQPPDFPEEAIHLWHEEIRDRFEDRFPDVMAVWHALVSSAGIYLQDVSPSNIKFEGPQGRTYPVR